jgi:hypothetical protein
VRGFYRWEKVILAKMFATAAVVAGLIGAGIWWYVSQPDCVRTEMQMVHHDAYTFYSKIGNVMVPHTTPARDRLEDVCVEWEETK